jgi:hypothetical protein
MIKTAFNLIVFALLVSAGQAFAEYGVQVKTAQCSANQAVQDPGCTPGAVLTVDTNTICVVGYTTTVRNVPMKVRKQVFAEYGIPYEQHSGYEVDHLISLQLGGSNNISNLWPEPYNIPNGARIKDKLENYLHRQVCQGKMTIQEAQKVISGNWLQYYLDIPKRPKAKAVKPRKRTL